ncbi:MAG: HAMP domain-containing histidine kinase [Bacteroidales bacterium]|nr:HAMP domain-containing histidine kinase [Bacteroidales bacterium]
MIKIDDCVTKNYSKVSHEAGISSIESELYKKQTLVVVDDDDKYVGLLFYAELAHKPHKLVIDCMSDVKLRLTPEDNVSSIVEKFNHSNLPALPYFVDDVFTGILEKICVIDRMRVIVEKLYSNSHINQKLRKNFLNNITHEIRTPLSILVGFLDIIAEIDVENFRDESKEYRKMLDHNIKSFLTMMNSLIEVSRIESGEALVGEITKFSVKELFDELKEFFELRAKISRRIINFEFVVEDGCDTLTTDYNKLKQVLYNLLENATKFTTNNKVTCVLGKSKPDEPQGHVFSVTNGFSHELFTSGDELFVPFSKEYSGKNYKTGLGIGLAHARMLAESFGYHLDYVSKKELITFYLSGQSEPN